MQPKFRKKLQLARETVRSLVALDRDELGKVVGGVSRETCNSKDVPCTITPTVGGVSCNTVDSMCPTYGETC